MQNVMKTKSPLSTRGLSEEEKFQILRDEIKSEDIFREVVLLELLRRMKFEPVLRHGAGEKGKDIVWKEKNRYGKIEWNAVVAKIGDITASASSATGIQAILRQVNDAFTIHYDDPESRSKVLINRVFVITNGKILDTAQDHFRNVQDFNPTARANLIFYSGKDIVERINEKWKEFWQEGRKLLSKPHEMDRDSGLVLYVLAIAYNNFQKAHKAAIAPSLSRRRIQEQTGLTYGLASRALEYLEGAQYVKVISGGTFMLDDTATAPYILLRENDVEYFEKLAIVANSSRHFTKQQAFDVQLTEKEKFSRAFVEEVLVELEEKGYIEKDKRYEGGEHFKVTDTIQSERPYLDCWLKYHGAIPHITE